MRPAAPFALDRRTFLSAGLSAAITAATLGCRRAPDAATGVLRVAAGADRYNTAVERFTFTTSRPNAQIAETPVAPDAIFRAQPWLFEQWSSAPGGAYEATLRSGVRFHDGTPLTADQFIASARRFLAARDFIGLDPASLTSASTDTVRFRSRDGSALLVDNLTHPGASIVRDDDHAASAPIGTGPYRFGRYEPQRLLEVTRFDDYWGRKPAHAGVIYRFVADPLARLLALQTGDVDVVAEVDPEMLVALPADDARVRVWSSRPLRYAALLCNLNGTAPFDTLRDVRVRRALALAIDREALQRVMYRGRAVVARGVLPGWMFDIGDDLPKGFGHEPARAESLLDAAGWRRGSDGRRRRGDRMLRLRLVAAFPEASAVKPMPELIAQMLERVGITIELIDVRDQQLYYAGYADLGQGDLFFELAGNVNSDPTFLLHNVFHSHTPWPSYRFNAPGGPVDALLDQARSSSSHDAAADLVRQAHRALIDDHVAAIPLLLVPAFVLTRPGFTIAMRENPDWIAFGDVTAQP